MDKLVQLAEKLLEAMKGSHKILLEGNRQSKELRERQTRDTTSRVPGNPYSTYDDRFIDWEVKESRKLRMSLERRSGLWVSYRRPS